MQFFALPKKAKRRIRPSIRDDASWLYAPCSRPSRDLKVGSTLKTEKRADLS